MRIKAEEPISLWPKAAETYYRWVRESIAAEQALRPVRPGTAHRQRAAISATGRANYVRAVPERDPRTLGESTALVFLGARLTCARCHAHPVENWGEDDDLGMAAFFSQVQTKFTGEWKEQIVYRNPEGVLRHPKTGKPVAPKPLGAAALEGDRAADPRRKFADWLTAPQNPWFAKNIVNRIWFWLMGRGIVHEPDDLRATNPPENPALLEYLEKELVGHRYDLKHIYRLVLNSKTYQLSSEPTPLNEKDVAHFSHYRARRLTAEQILDGLSQITEQPQAFPPVPAGRTRRRTTSIPADVKAAQIAEASETSLLAAMFGRPERGTAMERERADDLNSMHVQFLANSGAIEEAIYEQPADPTPAEGQEERRGNRRRAVPAGAGAVSQGSREEEDARIPDRREEPPQTGRSTTSLWTLLNTNEFLLNH